MFLASRTGAFICGSGVVHLPRERAHACAFRVTSTARGGGAVVACAQSADEEERRRLHFLHAYSARAEGGIVTDEEDRKKLWAEITALDRYLERLRAGGRHAAASEVYDEIEFLKSRDLHELLQKELQLAVEEGRHTDATRIRDELRLVPAPPKDISTGGACSLPSTDPSPSSESLSQGIRVAVQSFLVEEASSPPNNIFVFGYKVKITNESFRTVQLVRRHWKIKVGQEHERQVEGCGVSGRQPVLVPSESFSYMSMCPLQLDEEQTLWSTEQGKIIGSMRGFYGFVAGETGSERFQAPVKEFYHIFPCTD